MKGHTLVSSPCFDHRQEHRSKLLVDKQTLRRIARTGTLRLGVVENRKRHSEIRLIVHINMADAVVVLENRDQSRLAHRADEPFSAARDRNVDKPDGTDKLRDTNMVGSLNHLHSVHGKTRLLKSGADSCIQRLIGLERLLAAAKDHGVGCFEAERRSIHKYVRTRFEHNSDNTERLTHLADVYSARTVSFPNLLAYRIGKRGDMAHTIHHRLKPCIRKRKTVNKSRRKTVCLPCRDIFGVRRNNLRFHGL